MKRFSTRIKINASSEKVWKLLTEVQDWPRWNSTVIGVNGTVALGQKVTVRVKTAPNQAFPVKVTKLDAPHQMVWQGGMPLPVLFKGERTYSLTPASTGETDFSMEEVFDGLLAGLITKSIPDLQPAFEEFARCLKTEAEKASSA
jgi:hypothetical protein